MPLDQLPVPDITLQDSDKATTFKTKINTLAAALKTAIQAFNAQILAGNVAEKSAVLAGQHKDAAAASATIAGQHKDAAAQSMTTAGQHKDAAAASATIAGQHKDSAAASATTAAQFKVAAETANTQAQQAAVLAVQYPEGQLAAHYALLNSIYRKATLTLDFCKNQHAVYGQYGLTSDSLTSILTTVRASNATYVNPLGAFVQAASNEPRITYGSNGECLGLLVERSASNLLLWSQDFSNSAWAKTRSTVADSGIKSPDLVSNLFTFQETTDANSKLLQQSISATSGTVYSFSFYAKAKERTQAGVRFIGAGVINGNDISAVVSLVNGSVQVSNPNISIVSEHMGGGVYRFTFTTTAIGTGLATFAATINKDNLLNYTGDGISGIYIWGAQLTATSFPVSYIPTTTAQVTRAADGVSKAISGFSGGFAFMVESDFSKGINISLSHAVFGIGNATLGFSSTATIYLAFSANGQSLILNTIGQTVSNSIVISNVTNNQRFYKVAVGYDGVNIKTFVDGVLVNSRVLTNPVAQPNQLKVGSPWESSTGLAQGAYIHKQALYIPRALTDAELIAWSKP